MQKPERTPFFPLPSLRGSSQVREQGHPIGWPSRFTRKWHLALDGLGLTPKMKVSRGQESYPGHFGNSVPTAFRLKMPSALGTLSVCGIWLRQETGTALWGFREKL